MPSRAAAGGRLVFASLNEGVDRSTSTAVFSIRQCYQPDSRPRHGSEIAVGRGLRGLPGVWNDLAASASLRAAVADPWRGGFVGVSPASAVHDEMDELVRIGLDGRVVRSIYIPP